MYDNVFTSDVTGSQTVRRRTRYCATMLIVTALIIGCDVSSTDVDMGNVIVMPVRGGETPPDMTGVMESDVGPPCQEEPESCNGLDDDCDGEVDEELNLDGLELGVDCVSGYGICAVPGVVSCVTLDVERESDGQLQAGEVYCEPQSSGPLPVLNELNVECDGLDNDCDSYVDEHFSITLEDCGDGACAVSALTVCSSGEVVSQCRDGEPVGLDDNCDGFDDDCDGRADENYIPIESSCGVGACINQGFRVCRETGEQFVCEEMPPAEADDDCDGVDDDCDGRLDEDFVEEPVTCGFGLCLNAGIKSCDQGAISTVCQPREAADTDVCDGLDNDCDQRIDEGHVITETTCGQGVCVNNGLIVCQGNSPTVVCSPLMPASDVDLCNGADDDCDGEIDEDHQVAATQCGYGVCVAQGELRCEEGNIINTCTPSEPQAGDLDALCDQIDSDCDGRFDESFSGALVSCGAGACSATGEEFCSQGVILNTCVTGEPADNDANCDNLDDDCDGSTDEDYTPSFVFCGDGVCTRQSFLQCTNGTEVNSCVAGDPTGDDHNCDGLDDDCDGRVDESYVPSAVSCGLGVCQRGGLLTCQDGVEVNTCQPGEDVNPDVQCDQADNDCDGFVDEGYAPEEVTCGAGACQRTGDLICSTQGLVNTCQPLTPPEGELDRSCNGFDDDCDGVNDEGYQSVVLSCGLGECRRNGQTVCSGGEIVDQCTAGEPIGADINCDLRDDDCDGEFDEAYVPISIMCPVGACSSEGLELCSQNGIINNCVFGAPNDETCNGVDEDCDGTFDEDYTPPEVVTSCGVGECAAQGALACADGDLIDTCEELDPQSELDTLCDNRDVDCDGVMDEDFSASETCGVGACRHTVNLSCEDGVASTCTPLPPSSPYDICNSQRDDNCDGVINPDYANLGLPCTTGQGECQAMGQWTCNSNLSGITCKVIREVGIEICGDRIDNDCDLRVDERCPGGG